MIEIQSYCKAQPAYRVCVIGEDGKIKSAIPILALNDKEALKMAHLLVDDGAIELWDRERKVILLSP